MMRIIAEAYTGINMLLTHSSSTENPLSWNEISMCMKNELQKMSRMKEVNPRQSEKEISAFFEELSNIFKAKISEMEEKI